ncbi:MAG: anthranilate synthase component I family protein [Pseudomonadota bacterium]
MPALKFSCVEKLADTDTPVSAYLKLCAGRADSMLLESVEMKDVTGRYSVIAYDPIYAVELRHDLVVSSNGGHEETYAAKEFFSVLRGALGALQCESPPQMPAVGSLAGFIGYDAVRLIERLPNPQPSELPTARLVFPSRFVVFDHLRRVMSLVALDKDGSVCGKKIAEMESLLRSSLPVSAGGSFIQVMEPDKDRFTAAVLGAQEYIKKGDIFQVVLSDSFGGPTDIAPFEVYRRLRVRSPSPYMFFLDYGGYQLAGCSPETLVKVGDGVVVINPIAGTRGRSGDPEKDRRMERELLECEKERAEHIMLVDLARNDVGRVAKYGTVAVEPYMQVERYSHVMHIVSQVRGTLRDGVDAIDAFIAGFPAGTVSGAPKVRAMEIIDELEPGPRGPYAGAVGYFTSNDVMDTCIAIRTILFHDKRFTIRVGAGIVADSVPEMEYKELKNKAAQSLAALRATAEGTL